MVKNNFVAQEVMNEYEKDYKDDLLLFNRDEKRAAEYANRIIVDKGKAALIGLGGLFAAPLLPESALIGGAISRTANTVAQYVTTGEVNTTDVVIWTGVGAITGGYGTGLWGTVGWGMAGGATLSYLKDENPVANKYIHEASKGTLGITGHFTESSIPSIGGGISGAVGNEFISNGLNDYINSNQDKK